MDNQKVNYITSIVSFVLFIVLVFFFVISLAIRYRKRKQETEALKAELLKIQAEIQEETMNYVSRELHDNLGHIASLVKIQLNTISSTHDNLDEKLEQARELTRRLIVDLKLLSVRLSDRHVTEHGLLQAVENEVKALNKTGNFTAQLELTGAMPVVENDKAIVVYRMVQEVINNFIKHSGGSELKINVLCMENFISLELSDNGRGFNAGEQQGEGAGLKNLRYRAHLINATLDVNSSVGDGTTVIIKFPT